MKIAYIVPSIVRSGPIRVVEQLVEGLAKSEEVDLFYLKEREDRQLIDFGDRARKIDFFEAIDFDRYDIVHSHTIKADAYLRWHKKRIERAVTLSTVHTLAYEDLPMQYGRLKGKIMADFWGGVLRSFDGAICLTAGAVEYYKKRWRGVHVVGFVHNGIDAKTAECGDYDRRVAVERSKKRIGLLASAGGVGERKGVDQVIRALVDLPEYELHVAGKHTETTAKLKSLARSLGVEDRVRFSGFVENVDCFVDTMDLMVAPSRSEGFGLSVLESAKMKRALVLSDIPTFRELFSEDEAFFFQLDDIPGLTEAIRSAAMEKSKIEKAYHRFVNEYTTLRMVQKYRNIYREMIDSKQRKARDR